MIYIFITIVVFLFSFYLFYKFSGISKKNPFNMIFYIFTFDLTILSLIGSLLIVLQKDCSATLSGHLNITFEERLKTWVTVLYTLLAMPVGMYISKYLFKCKNIKQQYNIYINSELSLEVSTNGIGLKLIIYLLSIISIFSTVYTYSKMEKNPLLMMLMNETANDMLQARIAVTRNFKGITYIKDINYLIAPLLAYIVYGYKRIFKNKIVHIYSFIMFINGFLMVFYNGTKSGLAFYIIGYIFLFLYIGEKKDKKKVLLLCSIVFFTILFSYFLIAKITDFGKLLSLESGITGRVFVAQIEGLTVHFNVFPQKHEYLGFSSLVGRTVSNLFGIEHSDFSYRITAMLAWANGLNNERIGVMNTLFVAEAYASFGLMGIIISPIYVGFITESVFLFFIKRKKTPITLSFFSYFSYKTNVTSCFNAFLYNPYTMFVVFIFVMCTVVSNFLKFATHDLRSKKYENFIIINS